ncbi:MAG: hypothetical protein N2202_04935 [Proteobacteria bacterium]|nr:hypothetical protein [Pseudomonadota bacterium]
MKIPYLPLLIGSLPHTNPEEAVEAVFQFFPESPTWPQLPKYSGLEGMDLQYLENIPGWYEKKGKIIFNNSESITDEISKYLEYAFNNNFEEFLITDKRAVGLHAFIDRLKEIRSPVYIKGQVIGPITFLTSHKFEDGTRLYKDEIYSEAIPIFLKEKAMFQYHQFKRISPESDVIIFFDEPILSEIGSAVTNITLESAEKILLRAIEKTPFITGIHICGNSDWEFVLKLPIGIINFDAYNYIDEFLLYKEQIKSFVDNGGSIALGIIPTDKHELDKIDEERLLLKTKDILEELKSITNKKEIGENIVLTPSCGMGTLDVEDSNKVFCLLRFLVDKLKRF